MLNLLYFITIGWLIALAGAVIAALGLGTSGPQISERLNNNENEQKSDS